MKSKIHEFQNKNNKSMCKKIFSFLAVLLLTANLFAQAPQKMSYQAVIRNSSNALLTSATVGMKISIVRTSPTGTLVYDQIRL